jgi:hypothetical protein
MALMSIPPTSEASVGDNLLNAQRFRLLISRLNPEIRVIDDPLDAYADFVFRIDVKKCGYSVF